MSRIFAPSLSAAEPRAVTPPFRPRPSQAEVEQAVRVLIRWAGDDPEREGLIGTPERIARAYREYFSGYDEDPVALLERTFEAIDGYDEIVVLKDIRFESHCEHHLAPFIGKAHIAYLPNNRVLGISKLARLVEVYAKRLQIQEKMTSQIANTMDEILQPKGVAVVIEAAHQCMTTRGVHKPGVTMVTSRMLGVFRDDPSSRREVLAMIGTPGVAKLDNVWPGIVAGSESAVQQGRGGIGSRKHGVSGHAPTSPRFRLMNRLAAERGAFGEPARRRKAPMFASLRALFKAARKPR